MDVAMDFELLGHDFKQNLCIHLGLQPLIGLQVACPLWMKIGDVSRL
jgi:hypothetical protein